LSRERIFFFHSEKWRSGDAVATDKGAWTFSPGLYASLYSEKTMEERFEEWVETVAKLPRKKTCVLTWPAVTVFGFLAEPRSYFFLNRWSPERLYGGLASICLTPRGPRGRFIKSCLGFSPSCRCRFATCGRDMIDLQSFLWVQGSDEYPD
jgi:hypothetical protein